MRSITSPVLICLDYEMQTSIDLIKKWFHINKKARNRHYPAETMTDVDYADDLTLLANTQVQADSLLQSLKQTAKGK